MAFKGVFNNNDYKEVNYRGVSINTKTIKKMIYFLLFLEKKLMVINLLEKLLKKEPSNL